MRLLQGGPVHTTRPKQPGPWHMLARGDFRQPGEVVGPGGIAAVAGVSADWQLAEDAPEAERRKALAEWIADPNNPLTPRVIVNRLWGYHFGAGLVRTPSDFGFQGGLPSHPELLDWLAGATGASGRRHGLEPEADSAADRHVGRLSAIVAQRAQGGRRSMPTIACSGGKPPRRLEAEAFRDAVLAVSGELDLRMGGPGYRDFTVSSAGNNETYTVFDAVGGEFNRRSLYRTWLRTGTSPLLDMLDCPDPSVATPRRSVTSTPLQALSLLNNRSWSTMPSGSPNDCKREAPATTAAQVRRALSRWPFARQPHDEEIAVRPALRRRSTDWRSFCLVLLNTNEFLYVD